MHFPDHQMKSFFSWPLKRAQGTRFVQILLWWEARRLLYNLAIGIFGLWLFYRGDRGILALLVICANIWYTGGWIVHYLVVLLRRKAVPLFGPVMLVLGTLFSFMFMKFIFDAVSNLQITD